MIEQDYDRLIELHETINSAMNEIDMLIRHENSMLYERWKASGKQVTTEFMSMYPNLSEVIERIEVTNENDEEDETRENENYMHDSEMEDQ